MYNVNIHTQIQTHMNIWTLIKIYAYMYAAIVTTAKPAEGFK